MITASLCISTLAILHQRLAASRQRLDSLQNNRALLSQLVDLENSMAERRTNTVPSATWSNVVNDFYTRLENLGDELDELEAVDTTEGWVDKQQVVGKKLTEINSELDSHFLF